VRAQMTWKLEMMPAIGDAIVSSKVPFTFCVFGGYWAIWWS